MKLLGSGTDEGRTGGGEEGAKRSGTASKEGDKQKQQANDGGRGSMRHHGQRQREEEVATANVPAIRCDLRDGVSCARKRLRGRERDGRHPDTSSLRMEPCAEDG